VHFQGKFDLDLALVDSMTHDFKWRVWFFLKEYSDSQCCWPENVAFMSSFTLYTGKYYVHYSLVGKMRLPFIVISYIEVPFKAGLLAYHGKNMLPFDEMRVIFSLY
jgi:hypothetical protein